MNKHERRSIKAYNKKASNYDNTFDGKFTKHFKKLLIEKIVVNKDCNLLDVACGNGVFLKTLSEKIMFNGFGTDISQNMIECAKKLNPNIEFSVSSCDNTVFKDDFFDIITVCASFHHFPYIDKFANEMKRITKRDGVIYIAEIYSSTGLRKINNFLLRFSNAGDVKFYSPNEIVECFKRSGFEKKYITIHGNIQIICMYRL